MHLMRLPHEGRAHFFILQQPYDSKKNMIYLFHILRDQKKKRGRREKIYWNIVKKIK
jgi:hypothetical protein